MRTTLLIISLMAAALCGCGGDGDEYFRIPLREADIYSLSLADGKIKNLTDRAGNDYDGAWNDEGTRIAFATDRDANWEVYVMDADGTDQVNLTGSLADDWEPAWSPDGERIAFVSDRDGNPEIYIMQADGTQVQRITDNDATDWEPVWTPDGDSIVFSSDREGNFELYSIDLPAEEDDEAQTAEGDVAEPVRLTDNDVNDMQPELSPNGKTIVYLTDEKGGWLYFVDSDGDNPRKVRHTGYTHSSVSWSSDSTAVAYAREAGVNWPQIWKETSRGSTPITEIKPGNTKADSYPAWSPDGKTLAFTRWQREKEPL